MTSTLDDISASELLALATAVNRRRLLTYQDPQDYSSVFAPGGQVVAGPLALAVAPPLDSLRRNIAKCILEAPAGSMGGYPPTPTSMHWLWPVADADEDKRLLSGIGGQLAGTVGLVQRLNSTDNWTDPALDAGRNAVRAVHVNELRHAIEWTTRGRWTLPVYWQAGLASFLPDTAWFGGMVMRDSGGPELRSAGFVVLRDQRTPPRGLTGVTVRDASRIEVNADVACQVELRRIERPLDFVTNMPTWNEHDPAGGLAWATPGAMGAGDSVAIGQLSLLANVAGSLSGPAVATALQSMIDGQPQNLLVRRIDAGPESVQIASTVVVEWEI